jgi:heat shock protein HtpX
VALLAPSLTDPVAEQVAANRRRSWVLAAGFVAPVALVLALVALLVGAGLLGVALALVLAAAAGVAAWLSSDRVALRVGGAVPAPEADFPRYHNVVEGLCIASGLPKPRLHVVDDPALNAFTTGRNPRQAAVVVTTGLLDALNRMELEGVLAHELAQVKNNDVLVSTLAVTMVGLPVLPTPLLAPLVAPLLRLAVGEGREVRADLAGVEMTRYPPGLISALEKLGEASTAPRAGNLATGHLWIAEPGGADRRGAGTHQPLAERIALLREM